MWSAYRGGKEISETEGQRQRVVQEGETSII